MTRTLYAECASLFARFPDAVEPPWRGVTSKIGLMASGAFYQLAADPGRPRFEFCPWGASRQAVTITPQTARRDVSAVVEHAIMDAVVLPRPGSMFGWRAGRLVTALLVCTSTRKGPPGWGVMPRSDASRADWSPFAGLDFSAGFWDELRAGNVVNVARVVARAPGKMFWVAGHGEYEAYVAVPHLIRGGGWYVQPGVFARWPSLVAGPVPSVRELLTWPGAEDLAGRFEGMYG